MAFSDPAAHRRMRAAGDLYGRSLAGPVFYAIASLITAAVADHLQPLRLLGWLPAACYLAMFARVDAACYEAKAAGRNRVVEAAMSARAPVTEGATA
ncbi:MAG: hypothetical protein JST00_02385 [Deltaproteobacteria bacterium]|nr:hypothetical protein [Deltaproteobacteria bacterium]